MATVPADRLLTAEDLPTIPDDGYRYELVEGRLIRMPPPFTISGLVAMTPGAIVTSFVRLHQLGYCVGADGGVKLRSDPDTVRALDFAFFRRARFPNGMPRRGYVDAPNLAVGVVSVSDRLIDVIMKVQDYLAAGTRLVWVIEPPARGAIVFRPGREPETLSGAAALEGEDLLPGFRLPLPDLWEGLAEDAEEDEQP